MNLKHLNISSNAPAVVELFNFIEDDDYDTKKFEVT